MSLGKNLSLKLAAVAIACGLWAWVAGQGDVLKTLRVPLDITGLPADMEIVGDIPDDTSVRLRGPETALRALPAERVRVLINLASLPLQVGANRVPIGQGQIRVPAGIDIDRISPNFIDISLQRTATREVPVRADVRGKPADGFEALPPVIVPPSIAIEGPEPAVREVKELSTPVISIDHATGDQRLRVKPVALGSGPSQIRLANPATMVEVTVRIRPRQLTRRITGVPVVAIAVPAERGRAVFRPRSVEVEISGPPELVAGVRAEDLEARADLTAAAASDSNLPVSDLLLRPRNPTLAANDGIRLRAVAPAAVRVSWERPRP